jgi:hypothetical protein
MHRKTTKSWLRLSLALLAVCLSGMVLAQAAEKPSQPGDVSEVPAKNLSAKKGKKKKEKDQKSAKSKQKEQADSSSEIAQLKKQLALQQQQIAQLLQAMNKLQAVVAAGSKPEATTAIAQPSRSVAPGSVAQPSSADEVASLTPILPPLPKSQSDDADQVLAVNTPVNLPQAKGSGATVGGTESSTRSAVTSAASAPAGQEKKSNPLEFDNGKVKLGATFYGDYAYYAKTGYGPQFLTQLNQAGPGNDGFNSFDITRTYINFFYSPTDAITLRFTPNIYRQVGSASAVAYGQNSQISSSLNGNLGFRLKYAYVDFNHPFKGSEAFGKDKLTIGQTTNPLVDWEEGLYGYRYVNLTPWNYLSLSSTYVGATIHGPIMFNGKEYLDYHLGAFNNASFHSIEENDKKQVMGRLTWYPVGTTSDRTGFGLTGFWDYGYGSAFPDSVETPLYRVAILGHYQTHDKGYLIAGEYDLGRNAFGTGNMFSGVGPTSGGLYGDFSTLASAILAGGHTRQQGYDFFGHARLGSAGSPWALFGMYEYFQPNTNVNNNPLDFHRIVGGISYKYNKYLEFALDSQNLMYSHGQFTFPANELPSITTPIPNAVPTDTNAIFFNVLFNY